MTRRFSTSDWEEYWIAEMSPVVWFENRAMAAEDAYEIIMARLGSDGDMSDPAVMREVMNARQAVWGANCLMDVGGGYHDISAQRELGYTLAEWQGLTREERGRLLAHFKIHNMIEHINAYLRHVENDKKKERQSAERVQNKRPIKRR